MSVKFMVRHTVRYRLRILSNGRGQWYACALGPWGKVLSKSKPGRLDEAEQAVRNYREFQAWERS